MRKKKKRCVGSSETVKSQGSGEVVEKRHQDAGDKPRRRYVDNTRQK
jgi:hypothetical protein